MNEERPKEGGGKMRLHFVRLTLVLPTISQPLDVPTPTVNSGNSTTLRSEIEWVCVVTNERRNEN